MADKGGIVNLARRLLKALLWLIAALAVVLAAECARVEWFTPDAPPPHIQLGAGEALSARDILFRETVVSENYTQGGFRPLVVYEVAVRGTGRSFTRPYTLHFFHERKAGLAVARKDKDRWIKLDGATEGAHPSVALSIRLDKPGIYALGQFE